MIISLHSYMISNGNTHGIIVIIVGNKHGDSSPYPEQGCLRFP